MHMAVSSRFTYASSINWQPRWDELLTLTWNVLQVTVVILVHMSLSSLACVMSRVIYFEFGVVMVYTLCGEKDSPKVWNSIESVSMAFSFASFIWETCHNNHSQGHNSFADREVKAWQDLRLNRKLKTVSEPLWTSNFIRWPRWSTEMPKQNGLAIIFSVQFGHRIMMDNLSFRHLWSTWQPANAVRCSHHE